MTPQQRLVAKIGAGAVALVLPVVMLYEGTMLRTYKDPVSILTACTGHTGPELRMGQTFTKEQCETMLYGDPRKNYPEEYRTGTPVFEKRTKASR